MEPISHQMQKLHLTEEERSPSPPKTTTEILSLKAIGITLTGPTRGNIITLKTHWNSKDQKVTLRIKHRNASGAFKK
jgi:hypothetical protein